MKNHLPRQEEKGRNIKGTESIAKDEFQYIFLAGKLYETAKLEEKIYIYS